MSSIDRRDAMHHDCNIVSSCTSSDLLLRLSADISRAKVCNTTASSGACATSDAMYISDGETDDSDGSRSPPNNKGNVDTTFSSDNEPVADEEYEETDKYLLNVDRADAEAMAYGVGFGKHKRKTNGNAMRKRNSTSASDGKSTTCTSPSAHRMDAAYETAIDGKVLILT